MKKIMKRAAILLLSALMMLAVISPVGAEDGSFTLTELEGDGFSPEPIPLLLIKISFDANGNGRNDYDVSNGSRLYADKSSEYYGEQWCYSSDSYWSDMLFGSSGSLKEFYRESTGGSFWFTQANESYVGMNGGAKNDGIVEVVVKYKHPYAKTGSQSSEYAESRVAALRAADEFVDFSYFDKNGNGSIDYTELAIVFVCGGYEYSAGSSRPSDKLAFPVHAHYTTGSGATLDGVSVGTSGFVRIGEFIGASTPMTVGIVAHELGHFIGAADLYDANGTWNYVGAMSLMASGSWNCYNGGSRGSAPAYMDPFNSCAVGTLCPTLVCEDGDYTLYSRQSNKGTYNVIKITTQNPYEYYLIENRYREAGDTKFDAISTESQSGIVIWHIDENITSNSGLSHINTSKKGHDPGVVVMGVSSINPQTCGFRLKDGSLNGQSYTFDPSASKYKFPISGTGYTLLTGEEAEKFGVIVSVKSYGGDEMVVNVSGTVNIPPIFTAGAYEKTTDSITFGGKITDLCGGDVTSCKLIVSKNSSPSEENGTVMYAVPDATGRFTVTFEGLDANTKYFCRLIVSGKYGSSEKLVTGYTNAVKKERTDYYVVYLYKSMTEVERSYEIRVKPGATLDYKFEMTKSGYAFCGWYLDAELTQKYDMSFTQTVCTDFPLYAKWVSTELTAKLTLVGAESKYKLFSCAIGDTFTSPVPTEREGYTFEGWYADEELTELFDFETLAEESGDVSIYAKWAENQVTPPETTADTTTTATETETTSSADTSSTDGQPVTPSGNKKTVAIVIISIVIVLQAVVVVLIIKAKKKKNGK